MAHERVLHRQTHAGGHIGGARRTVIHEAALDLIAGQLDAGPPDGHADGRDEAAFIAMSIRVLMDVRIMCPGRGWTIAHVPRNAKLGIRDAEGKPNVEMPKSPNVDGSLLSLRNSEFL